MKQFQYCHTYCAPPFKIWFSQQSVAWHLCTLGVGVNRFAPAGK